MRKYYKNLILCGDVDFLCLFCKEIFRNVSDVERHIRWEKHRKNIKNFTYMSKFKKDFIIKVNNTYYCEACNCIMTNDAKVSQHVAQDEHKNMKEMMAVDRVPTGVDIKRVGQSIKVTDNLIVSDMDWNSIIDDHCMLCDMNIGSFNEHKVHTYHAIKLIQTKVKLIGEDFVYRQINEEQYYCFTCKQCLQQDTLETHSTSQTHINNKNSHEVPSTSAMNTDSMPDASSSSPIEPSTSSTSNNNRTGANFDICRDIINRLQEFQDAFMEINIKNKLAYCRRCKFTPKFNAKAIADHIKLHESVSSTCSDTSSASESEGDYDLQAITHEDHGRMRAELAKYGKKKMIRLIDAGSKGYCKICDSKISAHIKNFKQHSRGAKHRGLLRVMKGKSPRKGGETEYETLSMQNYIKTICYIQQWNVLWINKEMCINKYSYVMIVPIAVNGAFIKCKCFLCDKEMPIAEIEPHCKTDRHQLKFFSLSCITTFKSEFVREVQPSLFHCGVCNNLYPGWTLINKHLHSWKHKVEKLPLMNYSSIIVSNTAKLKGYSVPSSLDVNWSDLLDNFNVRVTLKE